MTITLTHTSGRTIDLPWRPEGRKPYSGTAVSFLYNLPRGERANWSASIDGRAISMNKACGAAAEEMNAIRSGRRTPALPQF